jgi:hypothetical protein
MFTCRRAYFVFSHRAGSTSTAAAGHTNFCDHRLVTDVLLQPPISCVLGHDNRSERTREQPHDARLEVWTYRLFLSFLRGLGESVRT